MCVRRFRCASRGPVCAGVCVRCARACVCPWCGVFGKTFRVWEKKKDLQPESLVRRAHVGAAAHDVDRRSRPCGGRSALKDSSIDLSLLFILACSLGGARFLTEIFALRFVAAVDVAAAKTRANAIYIILALVVPQLINANAPQFSHPSYEITSRWQDQMLRIGLFLLFASLAAYWWLQRTLGTERLVVASCQPACCADLGVLGGGMGDDLDSDLTREPDDSGGFFCTSKCCRERGNAKAAESENG